MHEVPAHLTTFRQMLGSWKGSMLYFSSTGQVESQAMIEVDAQFREGRWHQVNTITPEGGTPRQTVVSAYFDAEDVFHLDTDRVIGTGGEVCGQVVVAWSLREDPSFSFSELISFHGARARTRTWHHFHNGEFIGLTLLKETRL
jgi:hypothetical protein